MSEDYTRRTLPSGWNIFIEKSKLKSDVNVLNVSAIIIITKYYFLNLYFQNL